MKIKMLKWFNKKRLFVLFFLLTLIIPASIYFTPKAYSYYQAFQLEHQGNILLAQSKYQEALEKYKESQNKWNDVEINEKVAKAQILVESDENYQEGLEAFEKEEYEEAIQSFLNVSSLYKEYEKTRSLLEEAKEKIKETEGKVKGVQTPVNLEQSQSSPTNTPTPQSTTPIVPTIQPTAKPDNTSKLMAMKNLFQKIADLNKEIIFAAYQIDNISKEYSDILSSRDLLDLLKPYGETIESSKRQISDIDRQIQNIIATCDGMECEQLYQEFVTRMESEGYVAR